MYLTPYYVLIYKINQHLFILSVSRGQVHEFEVSETMQTNNGFSTLVVGACVLALALTGATALAQAPDDPTVRVEDTSVAPEETTTVEVTLSDAPDGLSGYNLTLALDDSSTATLTNASTAGQFALTNMTVSADTVTLSAVDTDDAVGPGATEVALGAVTLQGETAGTTELSVTATQIDDDNGSAISPATAGGTVTVETADGNGTDAPDEGSETNQSATNETSENSSDGSGPGFGTVAALLALTGVVVFSLRRRSAT